MIAYPNLKKAGTKMIIYDKLWKTMKEKNISQYKLIKEFHISTGQLDRLRKNGNVNSFTLNQLCKILDCRLEDIAEYIKEAEPVKADKIEQGQEAPEIRSGLEHILSENKNLAEQMHKEEEKSESVQYDNEYPV